MREGRKKENDHNEEKWKMMMAHQYVAVKGL